MTDTKALDALIEAVEAGEWDQVSAWKALGIGKTGRAERTFKGSLDAAKALHEALLPGWDYRTGRDGDDYHALVFRSGRMEEHADDWQMCPNDPARAWLLSILKAYRAGL